MQELTEWREARAAFLALPAGSPDTRAALDRLANAEDALFHRPTTMSVTEALEHLKSAIEAEANFNAKKNQFLATLVVNLEKGEPSAELVLALRKFAQEERAKLLL